MSEHASRVLMRLLVLSAVSGLALGLAFLADAWLLGDALGRNTATLALWLGSSMAAAVAVVGLVAHGLARWPRISRSTWLPTCAAIAVAVVMSGLLAGMTALTHLIYFSQWHAAPFTVLWGYNVAYTVAGALFGPLVAMPRLLGPLTPLTFLAVTLLLARRLARSAV